MLDFVHLYKNMKNLKFQAVQCLQDQYLITNLLSYSYTCKPKVKLPKPLAFLCLDLYFTCKVDISTKFNVVKYLCYQDVFNL